MCTRGRRATPLFDKEDARPPGRACCFADRDKDDVDFGTTVTILKEARTCPSTRRDRRRRRRRRRRRKKKKKNEDEKEGARTIEKKSGVVSPEDLLFLNVFPEKALNEDEDTKNFIARRVV